MAPFKPGALVTVHSLTATEFNEAEGTVKTPLVGGRHAVEVQRPRVPAKLVKIKPENLRTRTAEPAPPWFDDRLGPEYTSPNCKSWIYHPVYGRLLLDTFVGFSPDASCVVEGEGTDRASLLVNDSKRDHHDTLLHQAAANSDLPYCQGLLRVGATLDYGDTTALQLACAAALVQGYEVRLRNLKDMIEFLLSVGADANRRSGNGVSLLQLAITNGDLWMAEALCRAPVGGAEALEEAPSLFSFSKNGKLRKNFAALVKSMKNDPPERIIQCGCGSRIPHQECHGFNGNGESSRKKGVPVHPKQPFPCPRNRKLLDDFSGRPPKKRVPYRTYGKCCMRQQNFFRESLNMRFQTMNADPTMVKFMDFAIERKRKAAAAMGLSKEEIEKKIDGSPALSLPGEPAPTEESLSLMQSHALDRLEPILLDSGMVDPAFYSAARKSDFSVAQPWRGSSFTMPKSEMELRRDEWNASVDKYIGLNQDPRERIEIEKAAKIGYAGGPLYSRCAACGVIEDAPGAFLKCSSCKAVPYCGKPCQRLAFKSHKLECGTFEAEPSLPSTVAFLELVKDIVDEHCGGNGSDLNT